MLSARSVLRTASRSIVVASKSLRVVCIYWKGELENGNGNGKSIINNQ